MLVTLEIGTGTYRASIAGGGSARSRQKTRVESGNWSVFRGVVSHVAKNWR